MKFLGEWCNAEIDEIFDWDWRVEAYYWVEWD